MTDRPPDPAPDEARRFCRFATGRAVADGYWDLPPDGLCLSSFVLVSPKGHPGRVLVGKLEPSAPWMRIGALDPRRVSLNASGWMLPSSHLLFFESPEEAARRVLTEQLGLPGVPLAGPLVGSETYRSPRHPEEAMHWDLEFLFRGELGSVDAPSHPAWRELAFVEPAKLPRTAFTRSHEEILETAGFRVGD
jgi:ADP-ribose pyrophosphatase YjhB (NUDIX family)